MTKAEIAKQLGISRPTLDKYLENGLPTKIVTGIDIGLRRIELENEIRILEYKLNACRSELNELEEVVE